MRYSQDTLRMALVGFQAKLEEINAQIEQVKRMLRGTSAAGRKPMSKAGRKRIAEAQKKRWAAYRKRHQAAA